MLQVNFSTERPFPIRGVFYISDSLYISNVFKRPFTERTIMEIVSFCHRRKNSPLEMKQFLTNPCFATALPLLETLLPDGYELFITKRVKDGKLGVEIALKLNDSISKGFDSCPFCAFRKAYLCALKH